MIFLAESLLLFLSSVQFLEKLLVGISNSSHVEVILSLIHTRISHNLSVCMISHSFLFDFYFNTHDIGGYRLIIIIPEGTVCDAVDH